MQRSFGAMIALAAVSTLTLTATPSAAASPERVAFPSAHRAKTKITAYLFRPAGAGPFPVVMALHGCAGLFDRQGQLGKREQDWTARFVAAGYAVLFPDSFSSRGARSICGQRDRSIKAADRVQDVTGATAWLGTQGFAARGKTVVIGWSNGGGAVMRAVEADTGAAGMIAFYPGCRTLLKREWRAAVPLRILVGEADDWTPAGPCQELAAKNAGNVGISVFPGAYHDFDTPDNPVHIRKGKTAFSADGSGVVHLGTNEPARQAAIKTVMGFLSERFGARPATKN